MLHIAFASSMIIDRENDGQCVISRARTPAAPEAAVLDRKLGGYGALRDAGGGRHAIIYAH